MQDLSSECSNMSFHLNFETPKQEAPVLKFVKDLIPKRNDNTFASKIVYDYFSCCFPKKEEELEIKSNLDDYNQQYNNDEIVDGVNSLFPSRYIREDEKKYFKFDKQGIINFTNNLQKQRFIRKFIQFDLELSLLENNIYFSKVIQVARCKIDLMKTNFTKRFSVEEIGNAIINPNIRTSWDNSFLEYTILKQLNENTETLKIVTKKQLSMMEERELYDKRTHFMDGRIFYCFSSSAPNSLRPKKEKPIRIKNYFEIFTITEYKDRYRIDSFHQVDVKIGPNEALIILAAPLKMKNFKEGLTNYLNQGM